MEHNKPRLPIPLSRDEHKKMLTRRVPLIRKLASKTQAQVAEALRIDIGLYSKYERRTPMPAQFFLTFCAYTRWDVERLLGVQEPESDGED